jgi:hypothetical protein
MFGELGVNAAMEFTDFPLRRRSKLASRPATMFRATLKYENTVPASDYTYQIYGHGAHVRRPTTHRQLLSTGSETNHRMACMRLGLSVETSHRRRAVQA